MFINILVTHRKNGKVITSITGLITVPWPTNFDHIKECGKLLIESQKIENVESSVVTSFCYVSDTYKK